MDDPRLPVGAVGSPLLPLPASLALVSTDVARPLPGTAAQLGQRWTASPHAGKYPDPIPLVIPASGISLLAGAPGVGKTAFLATLLKAFRDHQPIFGHQPALLPDNGIAIISADRSWDSTKIWFERAGWPEVPVYSVIDDPAFTKSKLRRRHDRVTLLSEFIDKMAVPRGGLIIVDPISLFLGGNLLDYDTCMVSCMEIRDLLRARSLTCIATAHSSKQKSEKKDRYLRLQDRILGSTALFGFTDTQMYLASPEEIDEKYYAFLWQPHMLPVETFRLARDPQGLFTAYIEDPQQGTRSLLLACFPEDGTALARSDLRAKANEIPLANSTFNNLLRQLIESGDVVKISHGVYARRIVIN